MTRCSPHPGQPSDDQESSCDGADGQLPDGGRDRPPERQNARVLFARAEGGVGLLTTALIPISHHIDSSVTEKGNFSYFPRIDNTRTNFMGWRDLAQGVHARNSRIFIQLTAGLGRVGNPQCLMTKYALPVSASWNPNFYSEHSLPSPYRP